MFLGGQGAQAAEHRPPPRGPFGCRRAAGVVILAISFAQSLRNYRRDGGARGSCADLHLGAAAALVAYTVAALFEDSWTDTEVQRVALFVIALPFSLKHPSDVS